MLAGKKPTASPRKPNVGRHFYRPHVGGKVNLLSSSARYGFILPNTHLHLRMWLLALCIILTESLHTAAAITAAPSSSHNKTETYDSNCNNNNNNNHNGNIPIECHCSLVFRLQYQTISHTQITMNGWERVYTDNRQSDAGWLWLPLLHQLCVLLCYGYRIRTVRRLPHTTIKSHIGQICYKWKCLLGFGVSLTTWKWSIPPPLLPTPSKRSHHRSWFTQKRVFFSFGCFIAPYRLFSEQVHAALW